MARYERQDHFHQRARREGMRSRAAYKLEEIQQRHRVIRRGDRVLDLGCWPGGWLQVAARHVGAGGRVVGIDRVAIEPLKLANVIALEGDLQAEDTPARLLEALGGEPAQVVLSDAAPKLTGVRATDRAREEALLEALEALIPLIIQPGGKLLAKLLEAPEAVAVERRLRGRFERARRLVPNATRKGSSESYLLALGFRGPARG